MREETASIHGHGYYDEDLGVFIPPIYLTAIFEQRGETKLTDRGTELKYSREENPTVRALERVLAALEYGIDALAFNSGMAAITTLLLSMVRRGTRVLSTYELYGTSFQFIAALRDLVGAEAEFTDPETEKLLESIERFRPHIVFVETITNPMLRVIDVEEVGKACTELGCTLVVDNTFASPVLANPLRFGARFVVHSLTKYIAGHNDVVGGCIVLRDRGDVAKLWDWRRMLGSIMQPFEAYLTLRGVKTLYTRFEKASRNAEAVAEFLSEHPKVEEVFYPGLPSSPYKRVADRIFKRRLYGGVVTFSLRGGEAEAVKFLKSLRLVKPTPSLGGIETLATWPHVSASKMLPEDVRKRLGITESVIRLSVGLEDVNDIIEDLDQALRNV